MNATVLQKLLLEKYDEVEQVNDTVIRFIKKAEGEAYAVFYIDVATTLPDSKEILTEYQDQLIGKYYFKGKKSLQWNNYLYFLRRSNYLETLEGKEIKEFIENDRKYARKHVLPEEEIQSLFDMPKQKKTDGPPSQNVLSVWNEYLVKVNIDNAILSDDDMPTRLKKIEKPFQDSIPKSKHKNEKPLVKTETYITNLDLIKYRKYPIKKNYNFGKVNLIFGANGSGKTSLLEAIELLYCGRNKRNPDRKDTYEFEAIFADDSKKKATNRRMPATFRNYNLMWYGQPEIKTNNLYQSFAKFNFLDTDAAVSLIESTSRIEDDLSKLLIGPEASKVWRNIIGVLDAVTTQLDNLQRQHNQIVDEQKNIVLIDRAKNHKKESDYIKDNLEKKLVKSGWGTLNSKRGMTIDKLIEQVSELKSIIKQVADIRWIENPLSIKILRKIIRDYKTAIEELDKDIDSLESLLKAQKKKVGLIERDKVASEKIKFVLEMLSTEVHILFAEKVNTKKVFDKTFGLLSGLKDNTLDLLSKTDDTLTLSELHNYIAQKLVNVKTSFSDSKNEYEKFKKDHDELIVLSQKLRQVADKILERSSNAETCPLCHTSFNSGELAKQMNMDIDETLEEQGRKLLANMQVWETELHKAIAIENASVWLKILCERMGMANDEKVYYVITKVNDIKHAFSKAKMRLRELDDELLLLDSQGFSMEKLNELYSELKETGYLLKDNSIDHAKELHAIINQNLNDLLRDYDEGEKEIDELKHNFEKKYDFTKNDIYGFSKIASERKNELIIAENLNNKLSKFYSRFPWPEEKPIVEVGIDFDIIYKLTIELQKKLTEEEQTKTKYEHSLKRKKQLETQKNELSSRIKRLDETKKTLSIIKNKYSLTDAVHSSLQESKASVEEIFLKIHTPSDFIGLGSSWGKLIRNDKSEAKLSEISTGQRSAFALSIFLSQNIQLNSAPPVILMDDPIAYVDDMNTLSFLDYLREIVINDNRQVFLATANEKLAALFERKFDFLGNKDFRRFDLDRKL